MPDLIELLPPTLAEIHELFGLELMLKLWKRFGGIHVFIPANPKPDNPLIDVLGDKTAEFCSHYSGVYLIIPKAIKLQRQLRNQLIRDAVMRGERQVDVALRFNLTDRHIQKILVEVVCEQQEDLFNANRM